MIARLLGVIIKFLLWLCFSLFLKTPYLLDKGTELLRVKQLYIWDLLQDNIGAGELRDRETRLAKS